MTLRSWRRRYQVVPQTAKPGGYRRYTAENIACLATMRDLIRSGMPVYYVARAISGSRSTLLREQLAAASRELDSRTCKSLVTEALRAHCMVDTWETLC